MRVLCLGMDGADHGLVNELIEQGRLPTLAGIVRDGAYGPLRSTVPAVTPTAWSTFLTGLNPARHGIFNFSTNANRGQSRLESARSRSGVPLWRTLGAAGVRSAFVTVPFTYPAEDMDGIIVSGYGGPPEPQIVPEAAGEAIRARHPGLVTAHHPMKERWWEDFDRYARLLIDHVGQIESVCEQCFELEPDLGLLVVDFMSTDFAGHLGYARLDPKHPAHDPADAGDELVQVYEAVDAACGRLIEVARARFGEEPTVLVMSDHGMKPMYWVFHLNRWLEQHGYLRYRSRSLQRLRGTRLRTLAAVDQRLARMSGLYTRVADALPLVPATATDRAFADIDFPRTRAYSFATGGQVYLGESSGAAADPGLAERIATELEAERHPETGEQLLRVLRKPDIYHGPHLDRAPELIVLSIDERVHVEAFRRKGTAAIEVHDRLDPEHGYGYSGYHGIDGILAARGPGIRAGAVPEGTGIVQMAATIRRLHGVEAEGLDGAPIDAILAGEGDAVRVAARDTDASDEGVYSADEEAGILERLRDLGYE
jgi:predicted AlkP superfamily phosphohydrolase/phosphomutase